MTQLSDDDVERIANALAVKLTHGEGAAAVARATANVAVQEYDAKNWANLGYNLADVKDAERLHKNLAFMETLRKCSANVANAVTIAVAVGIVMALLAWTAIGAKLSFGTAPPAVVK